MILIMRLDPGFQGTLELLSFDRDGALLAASFTPNGKLASSLHL
jgi:hypothetical protein